MENMSKKQKRKVLIVRIACLVLAGLMVFGTAYLAISSMMM